MDQAGQTCDDDFGRTEFVKPLTKLRKLRFIPEAVFPGRIRQKACFRDIGRNDVCQRNQAAQLLTVFWCDRAIGFSVIAHRFGHITYQTDKKKIARIAALAALGGLIFNTIFDPLVGYFYKLLILGKPAAELTLAWNITATAINTVISTIVSVLVYMALLPALKKSGLFFQVGKEGSSK